MQAGFFVGLKASVKQSRTEVGAQRSGCRFLFHHQAIQCRADFREAACYHCAASIARIGADANALYRLGLLSYVAQGNDCCAETIALLTLRGRAPRRDGPGLDRTRCGCAGRSRPIVRWGIACSILSGSVANEKCPGQVVNHDELRLTADEVRQDSTGTTRRDRITGRVMPMPATRLVARESVQQLVADQAHGQTFQFEVILIR